MQSRMLKRSLFRGLGAAAAVIALAMGASALQGAGARESAVRLRPCPGTQFTASIGGAATEAPRPDRLTIVLGRDAGFNSNGAAVEPDGVRKDGALLSFKDTLGGIAPEVDGDLAFVNLETVITDRNDLVPDSKGQKAPYNFKSHPLGVKALIDTGFNLFSLANNHSMDYGANGAEETLYHMAVAAAERPIAYAGIGTNIEEATRPGCLEYGGSRIAFGATGIVTGQREEHRAGKDKTGQASYRNPKDFELVVNRLVELRADYRILSIHYGLEGRVVPDQQQLKDWRGFAAREKGIDLIVGHHPHVAQGVEMNGASLIFYGLGNFSPSRHRRDDPLRHLPRLRTDGEGASGPHPRLLARGGHRGDPAHQDANPPGTVRPAGKRQAHLRPELSRCATRRRQVCTRRALHAAQRRLRPL